MVNAVSELPADIPQPDAKTVEAPLPLPAKIAFLTGSIALLTAMASDAIAVAGRHIGIPLLGSIEIVQTAASVAGASAIMGATLVGAHASIHILTDRVSPGARRWLLIAANLLAASFFAILTIGCAWIAWDLHAGHEQTELLTLPLLPFRIFATAAFLTTTLAFIWKSISLGRGA